MAEQFCGTNKENLSSAASAAGTADCPEGWPEPETLILAYQPLVKATAARIWQTLPPSRTVDLEDLVQAGFVGLVNAAHCYDPHSEVFFPLYARYRIRGEILDTLRRADLASRQLRRFQKALESARATLVATLHREPSEEEILQSVGTDAAGLREQYADLLTISLLSRASREDRLGGDCPGHPDSRPDAICSRNELRRALHRAIRRLSKRHRKVIWLYYSHEMTLKEIGQAMQVNESRVSQLRKGALHAMARALRSHGIRRSTDLLRENA